MQLNDAFPSKFITAADLRGQDHTVTIQDVQMGEVGQNSDVKPILFFVDKPKGMVMNKTNGNTIASTLGPDTDNWRGHSITIYPSVTTFNGEEVDCIRVRRSIVQPPALQTTLGGTGDPPPIDKPMGAPGIDPTTGF